MREEEVRAEGDRESEGKLGNMKVEEGRNLTRQYLGCLWQMKKETVTELEALQLPKNSKPAVCVGYDTGLPQH